jgi:hypothetical protein
VAGRIRSIEKSNGLFGNRTRDLPACSTVPELRNRFVGYVRRLAMSLDEQDWISDRHRDFLFITTARGFMRTLLAYVDCCLRVFDFQGL